MQDSSFPIRLKGKNEYSSKLHTKPNGEVPFVGLCLVDLIETLNDTRLKTTCIVVE